MKEKIIKAEGHGQSSCYKYKQEGRWSLSWTSFLYKIKNDNYEHLYCWECANKLTKED